MKNNTPLTNLNEIDLKNLIQINSGNENFTKDLELVKFGVINLDSQNSGRRVDEKSEVKFYIRKYLSLKEDSSLKIFNKDYKNIVKKQIEKMTQEEVMIRKCLLTLYDKQFVIFRVHKDLDIFQFKKAKLELKIKDEDLLLYDDFLYYQLYIESIIFPQPAEPKSINLYEKFYIKKYQEEIRYLISVENYTEAISWANQISSKFFNMSKELSKQITPELKIKLLEEMKPIIMNKTLALIKKPNKSKNKDYEEVIKTINKDYFSNYLNKDEKWLKMTLRQVQCYLDVRDLDKAEETLINLPSDNEEVLKFLVQLNSLKNLNNRKGKKNLADFLKNHNENEENLNDDGYVWDTTTEELDLNDDLEYSVINTLN